MIKLPKKLTGYGLGARKFQKNPGAVSKPGDQSKWTETPTERARKLATVIIDICFEDVEILKHEWNIF